MGQTSLFRRIWSQVLVSYAIVGNKIWLHVLWWAASFGLICYCGQNFLVACAMVGNIAAFSCQLSLDGKLIDKETLFTGRQWNFE